MTHGDVSAHRSRWLSIAAVLSVLAALLPVTALVVAQPAAADSPDLTIHLVNARSVGSTAAGNRLREGDPIDPAKHYTWLITSDDTGNPNDSLEHCLPAPAGSNADPLRDDGTGKSVCQWPSIRTTAGNVPVIASGSKDDLDLNSGQALANLPAGRYLISVLADGYALGGAHFTSPMPGIGRVTVPLQPYPLPLGNLKIQVFHDNAPVDGTFEVDGESGTDLSGFEAHLTDVMAEVTTDWFGNPLCTNYVKDADGVTVLDGDGSPTVDSGNPGGRCVSDSSGLITIPNMGANRYGVTLSKPAKFQDWVQTTTLEGTHDHDVWVMPGDTGNDTEMVVGGEPVPWVQFGYIEPKDALAGGAHITGQVLAGLTYVGGNGGITIPGGTGTTGGKEGAPIDRPWVSLSDLGNGDQMLYTKRGTSNGTFDISGVPNGTYQLTAWDDNQDYIIYSSNVTVTGGKDVDTGKTYLSGWTGRIYGTVFIDENANGKRDPGEKGVPGTALTLRERDNSLLDQMQNTVTTNSKGEYAFSEAYPLTKWVILEHFNTRYEGTGITFQGENDPNETTLLGGAVDVNTLPILGLGGRVDWGVRPYRANTNGGIVGTITYDTTRNELDPAYSATEPYQPGIPGLTVHLYPAAKDANGDLLLQNGHPFRDPAAPELNSTVSETWAAPKGCTPRQWDGSKLNLAALPTTNDATCVEAPSDGAITMPSEIDKDNVFAQTVNGNYGFADSTLNLYPVGDPDNPGFIPGKCPETEVLPCVAGGNNLPLYANLKKYGYTDPQPLIPDDYVVTVDMGQDHFGHPIYQATGESDVNVFDGDSYVPQDALRGYSGPTGDSGPGVPAPSGGLTPEAPPSQGGGLGVSPCVGPDAVVHVTNSAFNDGGGSPYEGDLRPSCDEKLVTVRGGQAVAPNFNLFTQTPLPTHFWGLTINDLGLSWDKRSIQYGEAQGLPGVPMGIYDFSGNLLDTTTTDFNGFYEAIEPSTSSYNCPLPAGPCAGMYRFVGNDPGQPGQPNPGYNPRYRTIATNFQAWPGLFTVTDTAPTQTGAVIITPGTTTPQPVNCSVSSGTPEVFAVSTPWIPQTATTNNQRRITVTGQGFGSRTGQSRAQLVGADGVAHNFSQGSNWSSTQIAFVVDDDLRTSGGGQYQLQIRNGQSGAWSSSAITLHIQGAGSTGYQPTVVNVGPGGGQIHTIQEAIDNASSAPDANTLILINPGSPSAFNPQGAYIENIIVHNKVKLQGYGPGGDYAGGGHVAGSVIDGQGFNADGATGTAWFALAGQPHAGPSGVPDAAAVTVLPTNESQFPGGADAGYASLDGLRITGGYQQDIAGNLNAITGANVTGFGAPGAAITQGGGVYVHAFARNLHVTNDLIIGNSGSYGGGVRVGTPYTDNNSNTSVRISYNRIRDNGGTNLAGGIGLFDGSDGYSVDHNDICGNFSAEYGGGVSAFGLSPNGVIDHNRVWFNESYDEGGGVMVAGELPADASNLSNGSGPVSITANEIVVNNANDDGGGIRLLQVNDALMTINNNIIADNLSTHEGGGVALDDATNVMFLNNTVARNLTTATAVTSDGSPAPAGLSTGRNSDQLQATLAGFRSRFSNPIMRNNVFWENKAGTWDGTTIKGIGLAGDSMPENIWDMGAADGSGLLAPTYSVLTRPNPGQATTTAGPNIPGTIVPLNNNLNFWRSRAPHFDQVVTGNSAIRFANPYSVSVDVSTLRTFPGFRQSVIVVRNLAPDQQGNYHILAGSTATNLGIATTLYGPPWYATQTNVDAPQVDIDGNVRYAPPATPTTPRIDAGADER